MNIDPVTRGLIDRFAPHLGRQVDSLQQIQVAFSMALTPAQQQAVRGAIGRGANDFVTWSKTDAGIAAIRTFTDAFTGMTTAPQRPAETIVGKSTPDEGVA